MKRLLLLLSIFPLLVSGQVVDVGTTDNDGTGDPIRTAFQKINTQFGADSLKWRSDINDSLNAPQDSIFFDAFNYLVNGGSGFINLKSKTAGTTTMGLSVTNAEAGFNFGGLNSAYFANVNYLTLRSHNLDYFYDGNYFRNATDTLADRHYADSVSSKTVADSLDNLAIGMNLTTDDDTIVVVDGNPDSLKFVVKGYVEWSDTTNKIATKSDISGFGTGDATNQDIADSIANMKAGIFNVLDYGAVGDNSTDDGPAIQAAIDVAAAISGSSGIGAIVNIPPGTYRIATPLTLKSYVHVIATGAYFSVGAGYTTYIWGLGNPTTYFASVTGGYWNLNLTTDFISDTTDATNYAYWNSFSDMNVVTCESFLKIYTGAAGHGWNANNLHNIQVNNFVSFVRNEPGNSDQQFGENFFSDIHLEASENTTSILDSLQGSLNVFCPISIFDLPGTVPYYHFGSYSNNNLMIGSAINYVAAHYGIDEGTDNMVIADGKIQGGQMEQTKVVKKTLGVYGVPDCDVNWLNSEDHTDKGRDLGGIIPAKARVKAIEIVCVDTLESSAGAVDITMGAGNAVWGEQYIAQSGTSCDDVNEVVDITNPDLPAAVKPDWATHAHVWIIANPDQNWSTLTEGKWEIYVTYTTYEYIP